MANSILIEMGLDEKEVKVYLKLLQLGSNRASTIAYQLGFPRTTVQNILLRLESEKIVTKSIDKNVHVFSPVHPEDLVRIIEMKKRKHNSHYERIIDDLKKNIPELMGIMKSNKSIPGIKFYQGLSGVRDVLFDTLTSKTEVKDFANVDAMFEHIKGINDEYIKEREKTRIKKRSLILDTPFARELYKSGEYSPKSHNGYKFIDSNKYPFSIEMNIYDGKISYLTYVEGEFVGAIIQNEYIYEMHSSMWDLIWDLLPNHE